MKLSHDFHAEDIDITGEIADRDGLETIRRNGSRLITRIFWINILAVVLAGWAMSSPNLTTAVVLAIIVAAMPTLLVFGMKLHDASTRIIIGLSAVAYPAIFIFLLQGHVWQMDLHMYFFPALAALVLLCDSRSIIGASLLITVHHTIFTYIAPAWVFSGNGDLPRVALHVGLILLQSGMLMWIVSQLTGAILTKSREVEVSENLRASEALRREEQRALSDERERHALDNERRQQLAARLDQRVGAIVTDLGAMTSQLDSSRDMLASAFEEAVSKSSRLAEHHQYVQNDMRGLAQDVQTLAESIGRVGHEVREARKTAQQSADTSAQLVPKVEELASTMDSASRIIALIADISAQSRMLALNATIEASHEGSRGFGVVAIEMKSLADQTSNAASEISDMLELVRGASQTITSGIRDATGASLATSRSADSIDAVIDHQIAETDGMVRATSKVDTTVRDAADEVVALDSAIAQVRDVIEQTNSVSASVGRRAQELHEAMQQVLAELRAG